MQLSGITLLSIPPFDEFDGKAREAEIAKFGEAAYLSTCVPVGRACEHPLHDGLTVTFYADRYEHAFHTSSDRARRAHDKDKIAPNRIERLPWILPIIGGQVSGTVCKEGKDPETGQKKRAYFCNASGYIVWLNPTKTGNWRFSSAYPIPVPEITRTTHPYKTIWQKK